MRSRRSGSPRRLMATAAAIVSGLFIAACGPLEADGPSTDAVAPPPPVTVEPDPDPLDRIDPSVPAVPDRPDRAAEEKDTTLLEAQQLLDTLGYPIGPVDGVDGAQTRRGLCAWRRLEGLAAHRGPLEPAELDAIRSTGGLPPAAAGRGVTVDRTCQVLYLRDGGMWQDVHRASTGRGGLPHPGDYTIVFKRPGWHTSTLYPAPEPNMYNAMYFSGPIAIHGSSLVPPHPASAGCVRVTPEGADLLFAILEVGDPITVIGTY